MTKRLTNVVHISAHPTAVWQLTTDVERWPEMSPSFTTIIRQDHGPLRVGSSAVIDQPGARRRTWTVTVLDEGRRFEWTTTLGTVRMTGVHIVDADGDGCRSEQQIRLDGFGHRLLTLLAGRRILAAVTQENLGLKLHAERSTAPATPNSA